MDDAGIHHLVEDYLLQALKEDTKTRADIPADSPDFIDNGLNLMEGLLNEHMKALRADELAIIEAEVDGLIDQRQLDLSANQYQMLCRKLLNAMVKLLDIMLHRDQGDFNYESIVYPDLNVQPVQNPTDQNESRTLSTLIEAYLQSPEISGDWSTSYLKETRSILYNVLLIVGDLQQYDLNETVFARYKRSLAQLPANWRRTKKYRNLSVDAILAMNHPEKSLSNSAMNKHLTRCRAFFDYCTELT